MTKYYRIVFEEYDVPPEPITQENVLLEGEVVAPSNCLDFGMRHEQQMALIQTAQDRILKLQSSEVTFNDNSCSKCKAGTLKKDGFKESWFNDVFSDHRVKLPRRRCNNCKHIHASTVTSLLGKSLSGELIKLQTELGAQYSYRESTNLFDMFSHKKRRINNHEKIHATAEKSGEILSELHQVEEEVLITNCADELIIQVDGGHIKSTQEGERSFEAMTATVYKPCA